MDDAYWWVFLVKGKLDHFGYFKCEIVPDVNLGCPMVHVYLKGRIFIINTFFNNLGDKMEILAKSVRLETDFLSS